MSEQVAIEILEAPRVAVEVIEEAGVKVVEVIHPGPQGPALLPAITRVDTNTPGIVYVGRAPYGTSETAPTWTITRSLFSAAGVRVSKGQAVAVAWTDRETATYS